MKRAKTDAIDAIITALVNERSAICKAMVSPDYRTKLVTRLVAVTEAIARAKFDRDEIIRDTFYRGKR